MKKILYTLFATAAIISFNSCSDSFSDTQFYSSKPVGDANAITSVEELRSFALGAHADLRSSAYYGRDYVIFGEARSDEMYSRGNAGYFVNYRNFMSMLATDGYASGSWTAMYAVVRDANQVIGADLNKLTWKGSTDPNLIKNKAGQYVGQAYALRALAFFDLLKLYGQSFLPTGTGATNLGIILPTSYDPKAKQGRATIAETQAQIESDFNQALALLTAYQNNPADGAGEDYTQVEILNINSVKSLMSRYYLYKKDYAKVRQLVADVVGSRQYTVALPSVLKQYYSSRFNGLASNSIFEANVGATNSLSSNSISNIYQEFGYNNVPVITAVYNSFPSNDIRKTLMSTGGDGRIHLTGKYYDDNGNENIRIVRYEEVLLNGVEAELNGGSATKALSYYNQIITNRGYSAATTVTLATLQTERMRELIGEGFRYWDLLRWNMKIPGRTTTGALSASFDLNVPSGTTATTDAQNQRIAFPIPTAEKNGNPAVANQQNPGYAY